MWFIFCIGSVGGVGSGRGRLTQCNKRLPSLLYGRKTIVQNLDNKKLREFKMNGSDSIECVNFILSESKLFILNSIKKFKS